jgi:hypothetical protein
MLRPDIVFGPAIAGSLGAELVLMPLLYIWVARSVESSPSTSQTTNQ